MESAQKRGSPAETHLMVRQLVGEVVDNLVSLSRVWYAVAVPDHQPKEEWT